MDLWNITDLQLGGGAITTLKNMKVNGKDYPIYYGQIKMFQTTNQSILWGTGKKMLGNEELHFTPGKPRFPQILQGLGARNRWKFSSLGPGSMQLDHK